jgi:hypothetical protein
MNIPCVVANREYLAAVYPYTPIYSRVLFTTPVSRSTFGLGIILVKLLVFSFFQK